LGEESRGHNLIRLRPVCRAFRVATPGCGAVGLPSRRRAAEATFPFRLVKRSSAARCISQTASGCWRLIFAASQAGEPPRRGGAGEGPTLLPHQRPRPLAEPVEVAVAPVEAEVRIISPITRSSPSTGDEPKRSTSASGPANVVVHRLRVYGLTTLNLGSFTVGLNFLFPGRSDS
jgi:hypothetical protein